VIPYQTSKTLQPNANIHCDTNAIETTMLVWLKLYTIPAKLPATLLITISYPLYSRQQNFHRFTPLAIGATVAWAT
jgi:hypothetical protein